MVGGRLRLNSPWLDCPFHFALHDHRVNQIDDGLLIPGVDLLKLPVNQMGGQISTSESDGGSDLNFESDGGSDLNF